MPDAIVTAGSEKIHSSSILDVLLLKRSISKLPFHGRNYVSVYYERYNHDGSGNQGSTGDAWVEMAASAQDGTCPGTQLLHGELWDGLRSLGRGV